MRQWHIDNPEEVQKSKAKSSNNEKTKFNKKQVSSMVAKKVQSALKKALSTKPDDGDDSVAYISSLVDAAVEKKQAATSTALSATTKPRILLKLILKHAQNQATKAPFDWAWRCLTCHSNHSRGEWWKSVCWSQVKANDGIQGE